MSPPISLRRRFPVAADFPARRSGSVVDSSRPPRVPRSQGDVGTPRTPFTCPGCKSSNVKLATDPKHFAYVTSIYLRCLDCAAVWTLPKERYEEWERRRKDDV